MMNKKIAAITLAGWLSSNPFFAIADDTAATEKATTPTVLPGGKAASNEEKADKKGEEASGSNSGAESHETAKDAATSSDSHDLKKAPTP